MAVSNVLGFRKGSIPFTGAKFITMKDYHHFPIAYPETLLLKKYGWFPSQCKKTTMLGETAYYIKKKHYLVYMNDPEYIRNPEEGIPFYGEEKLIKKL